MPRIIKLTSINLNEILINAKTGDLSVVFSFVDDAGEEMQPIRKSIRAEKGLDAGQRKKVELFIEWLKEKITDIEEL